MNLAFVNEILNQNYSYKENDENPQPNPNMDVVKNIYDEIEKEVEIIINNKLNEVEIVDPKLFSNRWGCFFSSFF
jgi:hypothetical protein